MDLEKYWIKRGKTFSSEIINQPFYVKKYLDNQEKYIFNILQKNSWDSILEIGCGTGRLTKLLVTQSGIKKIKAIDISEDLLSVARKNLKNYKIEFQQINLNKFFTNEKFDLVFSTEVIQHISPKKVKDIISKLISLSKNKIILVETIDYSKKNFSKDDYFFVHDYKKLFKHFKVKNITIHPISLPISLKIIDRYIKLRNRNSFAQQAIIEISV